MIDSTSAFRLRHFVEPDGDILDGVLAGLSRPRKELPCKYFYDRQGSELFDRICNLPEYYPTRTEERILEQNIDAIADCICDEAVLVEYGAGSSRKTRTLLDACRDRLAAYVPIDISREHLYDSAARLLEDYPNLSVWPVAADYTEPFTLPLASERFARVAFFPGSTIGNFHPRDAVRFLQNIRRTCGRQSGLLIGVDLKKDPAILHAAYNDAAGLTARFNLNLLARINRELDADFDLTAFSHYAFYNPTLGRIEMHLVSLEPQRVRVAGRAFDFATGESIHTECSYKYTPEEFAGLAGEAGYRVRQVWMDGERLFSLQYLE